MESAESLLLTVRGGRVDTNESGRVDDDNYRHAIREVACYCDNAEVVHLLLIQVQPTIFSLNTAIVHGREDRSSLA